MDRWCPFEGRIWDLWLVDLAFWSSILSRYALARMGTDPLGVTTPCSGSEVGIIDEIHIQNHDFGKMQKNARKM